MIASPPEINPSSVLPAFPFGKPSPAGKPDRSHRWDRIEKLSCSISAGRTASLIPAVKKKRAPKKEPALIE